MKLKMLKEIGVAVNCVDRFGGTALSYALEGGSGRMSDELQSVIGIENNKWVSDIDPLALAQKGKGPKGN